MTGARTAVVLAEDDPALLWIFTAALEAAGLSVIAAADGVAALEASAAHAGPIGLLVSDVRMPRMGGFELADNLRVARPGLKVLFVSGTEETTPNGEPLLSKPFRPGDLTDAALALLQDEPSCPVATRHDVTVESAGGT
jgi:two-component system, cell cycle sensor histidine kinase and response regulator CckA